VLVFELILTCGTGTWELVLADDAVREWQPLCACAPHGKRGNNNNLVHEQQDKGTDFAPISPTASQLK
jgi:hypothetical protein